MPITYTTEQTIEVRCDGCEKTLRQTLTGDEVFRGVVGERIAREEGWLVVVIEAESASNDHLRYVSTTCSIPCAQASLGAFLGEHVPAPKPEPEYAQRVPGLFAR